MVFVSVAHWDSDVWKGLIRRTKGPAQYGISNVWRSTHETPIDLFNNHISKKQLPKVAVVHIITLLHACNLDIIWI
jgi:hypothetical protein